MRTYYLEHSGNVTLYDANGLSRVVWEKRKKYTERQIVTLLNEAYDSGRREALKTVRTFLETAS